MAQKTRIVLSYDGTDFSGWQIQPDKRTVQGTLEAVLYRFRSRRIPVFGAGRTDAGVHAFAQTAHFSAVPGLAEEELLRALNGQLPADIRILSLEEASPDFHARKSALSKIYRYRIIQAPYISPFDVRYALHRPGKLDVPAMRRAARLFIREADFTPFSSNRLRYPIRNVLRSQVKQVGEEISYTVEGNGFLKYMVRTIVGTLLEVGRGRLQPEEIEALFSRRTRALSSPTAPARGLSLVEVKYPPNV